MFVTVEGIDGSGKSTLVENLGPRMGATTLCEPTETWTGEVLRESLQTETPKFTDYFFFMADRAHNIETSIKPALEAGELVICDRYVDSTLAYQTAAFDEFDGNPVKWMRMTMEPWILMPDLTIFLEVDVDTAMQRLDGDEKYETRKNLEEVRKNYHQVMKVSNRPFFSIDATQDPDVVEDLCLDAIESYI